MPNVFLVGNIKIEEQYLSSFTMGDWRNGRRTRFRLWRHKTCGFKSHVPHHKNVSLFFGEPHLAGIRLDEGAVLKTVAGKTVGGSSPSPVATSFLKYVLFFDFLKKL